MRGEDSARARGRIAFLALTIVAILASASTSILAVEATLTDDTTSMIGRGQHPPADQQSLVVRYERSAALVRFDLGTLPDGVTSSGVVKATLKLWVNAVQGAGTIAVRPLLDAWSESDGPDAGTPSAGDSIATGIEVPRSRALTFLTIDVTDAVRGWLDGILPNDGLEIAPAAKGTWLSLDSKENKAGGHAAELEITLDWRGPGSPNNEAIQGPPGPQGPEGPEGPAGPQGPPGTSLNPQRLAVLRWYEANEAGITSPTGSGPDAVVFDGTSLWVANYTSGTLTRHRTVDGASIATIPVGNGPSALAWDGVNVWVANLLDNTVKKVRASDGTVQGTYAVGSAPQAVIFDGFRIWVANRDSNTVTALKASDGSFIGTYGVGGGPSGIAFDGTELWVTNSLDDTVTKLDPATGSTIATLPLPAGTTPVGAAYDGANLWVTGMDSDSLVRMGVPDGTVLGSCATGVQPWSVTFDGVSLWVSNFGDGTVTKLRASDCASQGTYAVGSGPEGIAFDGIGVWIVNSVSNTISKL